MQRWTSLTLRAAFIIGFLIILPVMAMPRVAGLLDQVLYGPPESTVPPASAGKQQAPPPGMVAQGEASAATHEMPLDEVEDPLSGPARKNLDSLSDVTPPPLQRAPNFLSREDPPQRIPRPNDPPAEVGPLDQATADKIEAVRRRLEELGAQYVRLEMSADAGEFHCLCHVSVNNNPDQLQPFEATRTAPLAAAQAVLASVEAWRNSERAAKNEPKFQSPGRIK